MSKKNGSQDTVDLDTLPQIPTGWCWSIASDVCTTIASGSTPKADKMYAGEGEIPFIKVYNLTHNGSLDFSVKPTFVDRDTHEGLLARSRVRPRDVLINIVGPPLGKVAIVPDDYPEWNMNQAVVLFRPCDGIEHRYVAYALLTKSIMDRVTSLAKATAGQFNIGVNMCRHLLPLPIAPTNEQKRIVAKIEELLSDLDAGVAALERAKANLARYRASVLKSAVEGKLTEAWRAENPPSEPASELLARILKERQQKWEQDQLAAYEAKGKKPPKNWQSKYKEPAPPDTTNLPELPNDWCWATVDQLICYLRNGVSKKPSQEPPGHRILRINAVRPMSVNMEEARYYDKPYDEVSSYFIEAGDLLFTRYNGSIDLLGVSGMVKDDTIPTLHPDKLIRVKTVLAELAAYVEIASNVGASRKHMVGRARTTAGQTGISGADVREMPIPLCPVAEQGQITEWVEQQLTVTQKTDAQIDSDLTRASRLRQSILKRAFEGKLVAQNGADEPADTLLARMRETPDIDNGNTVSKNKSGVKK